MEYESCTSLEIESDWYQSMCTLHSTIFKTQSPDSIEEELSARPKFIILVALNDDRVVGYKIGCQDRYRLF